MLSNVKFYDTSALLDGMEEIFNEFFIISSISLKELEEIKTSAHKDNYQKFQARHLLRLLTENRDKYQVEVFDKDMLYPIEERNLELNNDAKILATAIYYDYLNKDKNMIFVTNDISLFNIANIFLSQDKVSFYQPQDKEEEEYTGFKQISLTDDEMSDFYINMAKFGADLVENQYLIIEDAEQNNKPVDVYKKIGDNLNQVQFTSFESKMFGKIKPKDIYQKIAMDSLKSNTITLLGGPAGSGKSILALGYLFSQLERGSIDKIIVFVNPVGARDCAKLGFYKGTVREKILSTQAGHVLSSKLGDITEVERLLDEGKLEIIPAVDSRGYEVPPNSAVYILEAQNLTSDTLRMLLQRVIDGVQVIVDGDRNEQTDMDIYRENNGMKKLSQVFKGSDIYGQVDLQTIYRSKIAQLADKMKI